MKTLTAATLFLSLFLFPVSLSSAVEVSGFFVLPTVCDQMSTVLEIDNDKRNDGTIGAKGASLLSRNCITVPNGSRSKIVDENGRYIQLELEVFNGSAWQSRGKFWSWARGVKLHTDWFRVGD